MHVIFWDLSSALIEVRTKCEAVYVYGEKQRVWGVFESKLEGKRASIQCCGVRKEKRCEARERGVREDKKARFAKRTALALATERCGLQDCQKRVPQSCWYCARVALRIANCWLPEDKNRPRMEERRDCMRATIWRYIALLRVARLLACQSECEVARLRRRVRREGIHASSVSW